MSESFDMVCIERDELRAQRDELLAALKEAAKFIDDCGAQAGVADLLDNKLYPLIKKYDHA